jgi:TPR repeat protein
MVSRAGPLYVKLLIVSLIVVAMAEPAFSGSMEIVESLFGSTQFEKGNAAFQRGDYMTAMRLWRPLADQGDAKAQYEVGFLYSSGLLGKSNYAEAIRWWRLAADQHHEGAQYQLGYAYENGMGVMQNHTEALKWYCRAAEQGHGAAMNYLGNLRLSHEEMCPK